MTTRAKKSLARKAAPWAASAAIFIGGWEGLQLVAYRDPIGIPTVCYGETRGVKMGDRYTKEQCSDMLLREIVEFASEVERCVPWDSLPDTRKVAVVSLAYNIGSGGFCKSSVARELRAGNVAEACDAFLRFNRAGGVVWRGLTNRRKAERELCLR
jgi:lysozyme